MKMKLLLWLMVICGGSVCEAQRIQYGVTVDVNATAMQAKGLSPTMYAGYNGGGFARISLGKKWSLQPEVLYSLQNMRKSSNFSTYFVTAGRTISNTDISTHTISIPLLAGYRLNNLVTLQAGPEYDVMTYDNENLLKDSKPAFVKQYAGAVAGAEISFSPSFSLFAHYYQSLTNLNNIDDRYRWRYGQLRFGINVRVF